MIKAIFAQKACFACPCYASVAGRMFQASHSGAVGPRLLRALCWWRDTLTAGITEERQWQLLDAPPCRLFVDAASSPARLAAVLFCDGWVYYSDGPPSQKVLDQLAKRDDKQITSLVRRLPSLVCLCLAAFVLQEILAIMMALSTFTDLLCGRSVVLYSDNKGAEGATVRGSAKAFDHNQLVHEIWSHALAHKIHLWVERVPSKLNIADCPSRFSYHLMVDEFDAWWRKPVIAELYLGKGSL